MPLVNAGALPASQETYVWLTVALCGVLAVIGLLRITDSGSQDSNKSVGGEEVLRMAAAVSALLVNTALLGLVAKVIQLNESLTVAIAPLRSAQMGLLHIITHSDEEKVSHSI